MHPTEKCANHNASEASIENHSFDSEGCIDVDIFQEELRSMRRTERNVPKVNAVGCFEDIAELLKSTDTDNTQVQQFARREQASNGKDMNLHSCKLNRRIARDMKRPPTHKPALKRAKLEDTKVLNKCLEVIEKPLPLKSRDTTVKILERCEKSRSKSETSRYWTNREEIFLVGLVFDTLYSRGSLIPTRNEKRGKDACWERIKRLYDTAVARYILLNKDSVQTFNAKPRTILALMRHYKVLKSNVVEGKQPVEGVKPYFKRLHLEWETKYNQDSILTCSNAKFMNLLRQKQSQM